MFLFVNSFFFSLSFLKHTLTLASHVFIKPVYDSNNVSQQSVDHLFWGGLVDLSPTLPPVGSEQYQSILSQPLYQSLKQRLEFQQKLEKKKRDKVKRLCREKKVGTKSSHSNTIKDIKTRNSIRDSGKLEEFFKKTHPPPRTMIPPGLEEYKQSKKTNKEYNSEEYNSEEESYMNELIACMHE